MQAHIMEHAIHALRMVPVSINFFFILMKSVFPVPQRPLKHRKRGTAMPRLSLKVVGNPYTDVVIAVHAIA